MVLTAQSTPASVGLREAWRARSLAGFLIWRDLKVRYKQSFVGAAWAIVQPVAMTAVFALFLGHVARVPSGRYDYWLLAMSGLVPFTYFSQATTAAANSLTDNVALVSKVYFPRLLLPAAAAGSTLLDAMIASLVLVGAAGLAGAASATAPLALIVPLLVWLTSVSVGIGLAALNVRYRDVRAVMPLLLQIWLFATPVVYPTSLVPERWEGLYAANPMVGLVELERHLVLGHGDLNLLIPGLVIQMAMLLLALRYFQRSTRWFADVI